MTSHQIDNRSFIHVRLGAILSRGERKLYHLYPENGRTVIRGADHKHGLRGLKQKLDQDPDTVDRYNVSYNDQTNEIVLEFKQEGR